MTVRALAALALLATGFGQARGEELAAEVVAVTDDAVIVDVHGRGMRGMQRGWLIIGPKAPHVRRLWRELPRALGKVDCVVIARRFMPMLGELELAGASIDARQCGRHDAPWWAASQMLLQNPTALPPLNVTSVSAERLKATREQMAFPVIRGAKWTVRPTGKSLDLSQDGRPYARLATGFALGAKGWVVVAPGGLLVVAFDPEDGRLQVWQRTMGRWATVAVIDPLDKEDKP